jgi:hypothetical protein
MTHRVIWVGLGVVTVAIVGLFVAQSGSPIRTSATIGGASLLEDDRIEVYLDCGSGVVWDVDEFPDRVVAVVRMFHRPGDCSEGTIIELTAPLGDRSFVDAATGDEVEVANR